VIAVQVAVFGHFGRDLHLRPAETEFVAYLMAGDDRGLR
jgi:hypothetical protein